MGSKNNREKIGILTFHIAKNIGAQLQALALLNILKCGGYDVEFIRYEPSYLLAPYRFLRNVRRENGLLSCVKQTLLHVIFDLPVWLKTNKHYRNFQKKYFPFSSAIYAVPKELQESAYDCIVVGSDQIWNPEITDNRVDEMYTLNFESSKIKKIAYAASFSENHISKEQTNTLIDRLRSFSSISVREQNLKHFLEHHSSLNIDVVIDPTLLMCKEQWLKLIPKERQIKGKYILLYQARGAKREVLSQTKMLAEQYEAEIYDASGMNYRVRHNNMQYVNPIEFLNLIYYAEAIVTISFHGTALSLVLEKNFYSLTLGDGRDGRVENLLSSVGLESQLFPVGAYLPKPKIDYSKVENKLVRLRSHSLRFLQESLLLK